CTSMIDRWYNQSEPVHRQGRQEEVPDGRYPRSFKGRYRNLKQDFKFLIYENECFQEILRSTQRKLLKASRDRSFLLDRILNHGRINTAFSDSDDETESSGDDSRKEVMLD
ncbi:hypothetical protein QAD02_002602, partial [Eretmocerus hayati]